jgi:hypothetical protein
MSCAWWEDPQRGVARFAGQAPIAPQHPVTAPSSSAPYTFLIGLHNGFLQAAMAGIVQDDDYRALHDRCTDAPNYHFDKSRKACWAIVLRPGMSNDTRVVTTAPAGLIDRPDWLPIEEETAG